MEAEYPGSAEAGSDRGPERACVAPILIAAVSLAALLVVAAAEGLPIHDPDARYVGSSIALVGLVVAIFLILDVVWRGWQAHRAEGERLGKAIWDSLHERWLNRRGVVVVVCVVCFYASYLSYRNLKSYVPSVNGDNFDQALLDLDRAMFFGRDPAELLHGLLGTGIAAEVLSTVYVAFFLFIPLSIGYALIWSNKLAAGVWYTAALSLTWILGAASYYVLPALGPIYADPGTYSDLPETAVSRLQDSLLVLRAEVLADPGASTTVQSIAAFASLHTAILVVALAFAILLGLSRPIKAGLWTMLILTLTATVYFGWHYLIDDVAGAAIGLSAVWATARASGFQLSVPSRVQAASQQPSRGVIGGH